MSDTPEIEVPEFVDINGHKVDAHVAEKFLDGETGEPISDEEYDESKARAKALEEDDFVVTWEPLAPTVSLDDADEEAQK